MRLGARWMVGAPPHSSVPPELCSAVAEQERLHPGASAWTLTWLEGRPRAALDDLVILSVTAHGSVVVADSGTIGLDRDPLTTEDDDDWLA